MLKKLALTVSALVLFLIALTMVHDGMYPQEDSRIVWVCSIHGDGECGKNTPPILIDVSRMWGNY